MPGDHNLYRLLILVALIGALASACASPAATQAPAVPAATTAATLASFTDPFAYCASVGTIDTPDARYTGTPVPDAIINGFKQAAGLTSSTEPIDQLRKSTIWRCMDGKVYVCNFGANLPCDSKADTSQTPSFAIADYCNHNPDSDFIPLAVVGHNSIYSWHCNGHNPEIREQVDQADTQGYLRRIWYALTPSP